jgi:hypothetical protein
MQAVSPGSRSASGVIVRRGFIDPGGVKAGYDPSEANVLRLVRVTGGGARLTAG